MVNALGKQPNNNGGLIKLNDMSGGANEDRNISNDRSMNENLSALGGDRDKNKYRDQASKGLGDRSVGESGSIGENRSFQNGKETLKFDEFLNMVKDNCSDPNQTENFLILAFSMFDR
jgi:hypothetical protein